MPARCVSRKLFSCALAFALLSPTSTAAQSADLVYVSNVIGTEAAGVTLSTIEQQTAAALDNLGTALRAQGLTYTDVVASNVFLRDASDFQGMNGVYRTYFESGPPTRATIQAELLDPDALIQFSMVAARGPKEIITPAGLRSPELPYSWGIKVGSTLFLSGATSRSPETYQPVPGDVPTQTRRVFGNLGMVLEAGGMSFADLVSCKVFLVDPAAFPDMNGAYAEFVTATDPPARATVGSPLTNPVFSTEIQCVAQSSPDRKVVRPEARGRSPYSPGIDTGDRVYLAGVTARGSDAAEETRAALASISTTLEAASIGFDDVESVWVFLTDLDDWSAVRAELDATLGDGAPEPTVIGTRLMGPSRVEIQIVLKR